MKKDFTNNNFKGFTLDQLRIYYHNNVDVDAYSTFIEWIIEMRKQGRY